MKLVLWPLMGGLFHLVQRRGVWAVSAAPTSPLLAVPNVTDDPSTATVPITVLLFSCSAIVKGLTSRCRSIRWADL